MTRYIVPVARRDIGADVQPEAGRGGRRRDLLHRLRCAEIFIFVAGVADEGEVVVRQGVPGPARKVQPRRYARPALGGAAEPARPRRRNREPASFAAIEPADRSEEHTSELQSLMRNSYAVFCLK